MDEYGWKRMNIVIKRRAFGYRQKNRYSLMHVKKFQSSSISLMLRRNHSWTDLKFVLSSTMRKNVTVLEATLVIVIYCDSSRNLMHFKGEEQEIQASSCQSQKGKKKAKHFKCWYMKTIKLGSTTYEILIQK